MDNASRQSTTPIPQLGANHSARTINHPSDANEFRQLADAMPQIIWAARPDGELDYYNRQWFAYINLATDAPEELARWDRYVHPDDASRVGAAWGESLRSGDPYNVEFRVRRGDGAYRWFLVRALPVRDGSGSIVRWFGTCTDIEDRKRGEARDRFLLQLDAAVRPLIDPAEITFTHARLLGEHLDVDRCAYADVEADQDTFNLTGDYNRGVHSIVGRYRFADFGQEVLRLMREDKPYVVDDVDHRDPPVGDLTAYRATSIQAVICVPLHKDGRFVAAMAVHQKTQRHWLPAEVELLRHVAARCWESIERARVERALRESLEFHRFAAEAGRTGSWSARLDTGECTLSPMMAQLLDFPPGQTTASVEELRRKVIAEDRAALESAIVASIERDVTFDFEFRIALKDGSERWLYSRGGVVRDLAGKPLRLHGASVDLTERKRAEEHQRRAAADALAAAEANAKFRTFFEQGTNFAGVMALDGTLIEANRLSLEACGVTREQVIGKKFWDCGWWNRSPAQIELIKLATQQAASGVTFRAETTYFVADGSERFVDLVVAPVVDEQGRVLFIAPAGTDITDRRRFADERERLLDAERAARAEAETANRAKDKFLAVLSHELRTPLTPVMMTITAMDMNADLSPSLREDVAMIRRNIELEAKLIDDLLDLSRVTAGKLRLNREVVEVNDAVRHVCEICRPYILEKGIQLHCDLPERSPYVKADPARLQQILWNLVKNAAKFTPDRGEIHVNVMTSDDGRHVSVEVRDSGIGIAPAILPRIFDAFEQGDAQITRQFGGMGLGLAISKALVKLHQGKIWASSSGQGQGATFTVELPAVKPRDGAPAPSGADKQEGTSVRVLVVEDQPDTAKVLSKLLRASGHYVKTAGTAAAAMALAQSETFDVIVSDIGLPDARPDTI